jgi:hypothetical protein
VLVVLLVVSVAVVVALAVALGLSPRWRRSAPRTSRVLRLVAVAVAVGTSLAVLPLVIADQAGTVGIAVTVLPPVVLTLIATAAPLLNRSVTEAIVTWIVTALMFAYVVVYGLGVGLLYTPAALVLLVVALTRSRTTDQPQPSSDVAAQS